MDDRIKKYIIFSSLGYTIALLLLYQIAGAAYYLISGSSDEQTPLIMALSQIIFLLIPVIILSKHSVFETKTLLRMKMPRSDEILIALGGILVFQFFLMGYGPFQEMLIPEKFLDAYHEMQNEIDELYKSIFSGRQGIWMIIAVIAGVLVPAIAEEMLFRGYLQKNLEFAMKPVWAVIITSVLFALIHFNIVSIVPLIIIGAYLGILAFSTESIFVPIVVHLFNNSIAIIIINIPNSDEIPINAEQLPIEYAIPMMVISGGIMAFLCYLLINRRVRSGLDKWGGSTDIE